MLILQLRTKRSSGQRRGTVVLLALVIGCVLISPCYGGERLNRKEAAKMLSAYQGMVENSRALFPESVSEAPPMSSMGPRMVSKTCRAGWQKAFQTLVEKGYLSSFEEKGPQIGIGAEKVTAKGKKSFSRLTLESFYCTVSIISDLRDGDVTVLGVRQEPGKDEASATFETSAAEAFAILWQNRVFEAGCGGEIEEALIVDKTIVRGHGHFKSHKGRWRIEKVVLGPHSSEE